MNRDRRPALIIFAKRPQEGQVKTRLGATIGLQEATGVYARLLYGLLHRLLPLRHSIDIRLCLSSADEMPFFQPAYPEITVCHQCAGDIGTRMATSLREALAHGAPKAILIGSDVPDIDADTIGQALACLNASDVVLGPATDGGYYLVGVRPPLPDLFSDVHWSTGQVLAETCDRALVLGASVSLLDELFDIDTESDLVSWHDRLRLENLSDE